MSVVFARDSTNGVQSRPLPIESALMEVLSELGENRDYRSSSALAMRMDLVDWSSGAAVAPAQVVSAMAAAGIGLAFLVDITDWRPSEVDWRFLGFALVVPWLWHPLGFTYLTVAEVEVSLFNASGAVGSQTFTGEEPSMRPWLTLVSLFRSPAEDGLETEACVQAAAVGLAWRIADWAVQELSQPGTRSTPFFSRIEAVRGDLRGATLGRMDCGGNPAPPRQISPPPSP
jgi:hypothetical protein